MSKKFLSVLISAVIVISTTCGQDPNPVLSTIFPLAKVTHMPSFKLTATGDNFTPDSQIIFNDNIKETTFINASELICTIETKDMDGSRIPVKIRNRGQNSGYSNSIDFIILDNHTFSDPVKISKQGSNPRTASINPGKLNIIYTEGNTLFYCNSTNHGISWSPAIPISDSDISNHAKVTGSSIALDNSGNINVVYGSESEQSSKIFFTRSTDDGVTWSPNNQISDPYYKAEQPEIAVSSNGSINVVWQWYIYNPEQMNTAFRRSDYDATGWNPIKDLPKSGGNPGLTQIATDDSENINVVWQERSVSGLADIFFSRSTDHGINWIIPKGSVSRIHNQRPNISVNGQGTIGIVWEQYSENPEIFFMRSVNGGLSWSMPTPVCPSANSVKPRIAVDRAGNFNVIWTKGTTSGHVMFSRSIDKDGLNWSPPINLTQIIGEHIINSDIAVDHDGNIFIVCEGEGIYFIMSNI